LPRLSPTRPTMLTSLLSHILCAWFAFFLPCYSTFKALSHRPISEPDLEKWAMYWTVIGAFVAFEYVAEWFISWLPFYWEVKTTFLLFLSLPQTQGSTYVYTTYLQPFFSKNESALDADIITIQRNAIAFTKARLLWIWEFVNGMLNKLPASGQSPASGQASSSAAPPLEAIMGLWRTYSPSIISALQPSPPPQTSAPTPPPVVPASASTTSFQANPGVAGAPIP
jgi:receptor expression-enhancing protein 1/2/3/4